MLVVPTELRPSPIHGIGVFLLAPIKKGDIVWRFDSRIDRVFSQGDFESLPPLQQKYIESYCCWDESARAWLMSGDNMTFCNHSETPCIVYGREFFSDGIAAPDIAAGTELTTSYFDICDKIKAAGKV